MSLLLDALKQAEAAKQKHASGEGDRPAALPSGTDAGHLIEFEVEPPPEPSATDTERPVPAPEQEHDPEHLLDFELSDDFLALDDPTPAGAPDAASTGAATPDPTPPPSDPEPPALRHSEPGPDGHPPIATASVTAPEASTRNATGPVDRASALETITAAPRVPSQPGNEPADGPIARPPASAKPPDAAASGTGKSPPPGPASVPDSAGNEAPATSPLHARRVLEAARGHAAGRRRRQILVIALAILLLAAAGASLFLLATHDPWHQEMVVFEQPATTAAAPPPVGPENADSGTPPATRVPAGPVPAPARVAAGPEASGPDKPTAPTTADPVTDQAATPAIPVAADGPRFHRSAPPGRTNQKFAHAHQALRAGTPNAAVVLFRALTAEHPDDSETHKGLALALSRSGDRTGAIRAYLDALAIDPGDPVAQAGLLAMAGSADLAASTSRLRNLIATTPDVAFLHFALANLQAQARRWPEAQQGYFEAHRLEPRNAIYAFNLAVSLEHLRQSRLALELYRTAQQLVSEGAADGQLVDGALLAARIGLLEAGR